MQSFLSGRSVRESKVNRRNFQEAKNTLLERLCEWCETTAHESSAVPLFDIQKWMEEFQGDSNEEVYTLKTINQKLTAKYGDGLQFLPCECRIVVTLRKIRKTLFSLAERLHNVCKKAVNVKNSILIPATLL